MSRLARPRPTPGTLVIFGAVGDLSRRKLPPSLYRLWCQKHLHAHTTIIGVARRDYDDDQFREAVGGALREHLGEDCTLMPEWRTFAKRLRFASFDLRDVDGYKAPRRRVPTFGNDEALSKQVIYYRIHAA